MIFRKQREFFFIFFACLFLSHCGLRIGEMASPIPTYNISLSSEDCLSLNYKEEFSSYFLKQTAKDLSGQRLSRALNCIASRIVRAENLINHEYFEKQELINFLNQDFIKTEDMKPIINHIIDPVYFDDYILIKDNVVQLIAKKPDGFFAHANTVCQSQRADKIVFSKQEVGIFVDFLEGLSDFFLTVERSSYEVFEQFFKSNDSGSHLLSKSQLKENDYFENHFISFLSKYFYKDFPAYSLFLDRLHFSEEYSHPRKRQNRVKEDLKQVEAVLQPLLDIAQLPWPSSDRLTVQNIKYMMLNIYTMKAFFSVYDVNQDSMLSPRELEPLSCFITPLISAIMRPRLKNRWEFIQDLYKSKAVATYIIKYQKIPPEGLNWQFLMYLKYRLFENPENLDNLSYTDVSRLISVLFLELFNSIDLKLQ